MILWVEYLVLWDRLLYFVDRVWQICGVLVNFNFGIMSKIVRERHSVGGDGIPRHEYWIDVDLEAYYGSQSSESLRLVMDLAVDLEIYETAAIVKRILEERGDL